jgi:hypothetical protein
MCPPHRTSVNGDRKAMQLNGAAQRRQEVATRDERAGLKLLERVADIAGDIAALVQIDSDCEVRAPTATPLGGSATPYPPKACAN